MAFIKPTWESDSPSGELSCSRIDFSRICANCVTVLNIMGTLQYGSAHSSLKSKHIYVGNSCLIIIWEQRPWTNQPECWWHYHDMPSYLGYWGKSNISSRLDTIEFN